MEDFKYYDPDKGTSQGEPISLILANVYLHYVLELWIMNAVKTKLKGEIYLVRHAVDFIIMIQYENGVKLIYQDLIIRFANFSLEIEESKTRIISNGKYKGTS